MAGRRAHGRGATVVVAVLLVSTPTAALAQPRAAFPPEQPAAPAEPPPAQSPAQPRPAHMPRRPLYYPPPPPSLHFVGFRSDVPHTRFAIEFDQNRRVLGWCTGWCWVHLWPGRYRVRVARSKHVLGGSRPFTVKGPVLVTVSPQSHRSRAWLAVGIGSAVLVIGIPVAAAVFIGNNKNGDATDILAPALLFLTGAVLTPISWINWEHSSRPDLTVESMAR